MARTTKTVAIEAKEPKISEKMAELFSASTDEGSVVSKQVDSVIATDKKLAPNVHVTAVSCCLHVIKHGDPIHMNRLFSGLGGGWRKEALAKFFIKFAPVTFKVSDGFTYDKAKGDAMFTAYRDDAQAVYDAINKETFWDMTPENIFPSFDLMALVKRAIAKADKLAEGKKPNGEDLTEEEKAKVNVRGLAPLKRALALISEEEEIPFTPPSGAAPAAKTIFN